MYKKKKDKHCPPLVPGYRGLVTLVSPQGERLSLPVPGRLVVWSNERGQYDTRAPKNRVQPIAVRGDADASRQDTRFRRLLSQGWRVAGPCRVVNEDADTEVGEEQKKDTDVVIGTTKTGEASHGGDHASGEVKDSPNYAKRGCRGGRGAKDKAERRLEEAKANEQPCLHKCTGGRSRRASLFTPDPIKVSAGMEASAKRSAELLAELVGRSQLKVRQGVQVNAFDLLVALEIGDNPIPALEAPRERPRMRVLVSPDRSGSCRGWCALGMAWASHLSDLPDTDIFYVENGNGQFLKNVSALLPKIDVVIYLGDDDGWEMCEKYARGGLMVIALDCYAARVAKPRLAKRPEGVGGNFFWVERCSSKKPETWYQALRLALGKTN